MPDAAQLPLKHFDRVLRTVGPVLPLLVLGLRWLLTSYLPPTAVMQLQQQQPKRQELLTYYGGVIVTRVVVYLLHQQGALSSAAIGMSGCLYACAAAHG